LTQFEGASNTFNYSESRVSNGFSIQ